GSPAGPPRTPAPARRGRGTAPPRPPPAAAPARAVRRGGEGGSGGGGDGVAPPGPERGGGAPYGAAAGLRRRHLGRGGTRTPRPPGRTRHGYLGPPSATALPGRLDPPRHGPRPRGPGPAAPRRAAERPARRGPGAPVRHPLRLPRPPRGDRRTRHRPRPARAPGAPEALSPAAGVPRARLWGRGRPGA